VFDVDLIDDAPVKLELYAELIDAFIEAQPALFEPEADA
jgi:hypothetical protein